MSAVSGRRFIRPASSPVTQAAVPSSRPAAAPEVTRPASAPVISAMISEARACSSAISTQCRDASTIASATSARIGLPDSRVDGPLALMIVRTPRRS